MAREAKATVQCKFNGGDMEVLPVLGFKVEDLPQDKINYLIQIGLKQRVAQAVTKKFNALKEEIESNVARKKEMEDFEFPADKIEKLFAGKPLKAPEMLDISITEVFPKDLNPNAVEPTAAPKVEEKKPEVKKEDKKKK